MERRNELGNKDEWELKVNDRRVLLRTKENLQLNDQWQWKALSSAVLNGGCKTFSSSSPLQALKEGTESKFETTTTIGLMTAASMNTVRTSTRRAMDHRQLEDLSNSKSQDYKNCVIVDAVVTAGISNSRCAGADADYFYFSSSQDENANANTSHFIGTINTIILTNAILPESQLALAYAIAIEAKCRAATELGLACAKEPGTWSQGTGTDSTVLIAKGETVKGKESASCVVKVAGKHTLFGEILGQAVYEATRDSLANNMEYAYSNYAWMNPTITPVMMYRLGTFKRQLLRDFKTGHRPMIPSQPMMPVPKPNMRPIGIGMSCFLLVFGIHLHLGEIHRQELSGPEHRVVGYFDIARTLLVTLPVPGPSATVLLAVFVWDRFLGHSLMLPISLHPVVLVGRLITLFVGIIPKRYFEKPFFGFVSGCVLWLGTVFGSLTTAWCLFAASHALSHFWEECFGAESMHRLIFVFFPCRVGYRGRFEWVGKSSARIDDAANLLSARLTAGLLVVASSALILFRRRNEDVSFMRGAKVAWRDWRQCNSPNAERLSLEKRGQ
eukprot:scaffold4676_cov164-Amphora_coffeaeformis.AAC.2